MASWGALEWMGIAVAILMNVLVVLAGNLGFFRLRARHGAATPPVVESASGATSEFERGIERRVGMPIERIRDLPLDELRREIERRNGRRMAFVSAFPLIGRGNVLRDRLVDHDRVEAGLDEVIAR